MTTQNQPANTSPEVDDWFVKLDHPQKETMLAVRSAILLGDSHIREVIKWSTSTFDLPPEI